MGASLLEAKGREMGLGFCGEETGKEILEMEINKMIN